MFFWTYFFEWGFLLCIFYMNVHCKNNRPTKWTRKQKQKSRALRGEGPLDEREYRVGHVVEETRAAVPFV